MVLKFGRTKHKSRTSMEQLHAGWLTKSPPEYKSHGPWKIFKSQWRRRYFVLYHPPATTVIPGSCAAILEYYETDKMTRKKGVINLEKCEQIFINFDSEYYKHIFVMRTVDRDRDRTYYLAADTDTEMNQWVTMLCKVVGLRDESVPEKPVGISPAKKTDDVGISKQKQMENSRQRFDIPNSSSASSPPEGSLSPLGDCFSPQSDVFDSPSAMNFQTDDYLPLDACFSGPAPTPAPTPASTTAPPLASRATSVNSIRIVSMVQSKSSNPSNTPVQRSTKSSAGSCVSTISEYYNTDGNTKDSIYVSPTSLSDDPDEDIYNTPKHQYDDRNSDIYKFPTNWDGKGGDLDDGQYDYLPKNSYDEDSYSENFERALSESHIRAVQGSESDVYDIPLKSHCGTEESGRESLYTNSAAIFESKRNADDIYDFPVALPPKAHAQSKVHRYINAPSTSVIKVPTQVSRQDTPPAPHNRGSAGPDESYLPMVKTVNGKTPAAQDGTKRPNLKASRYDGENSSVEDDGTSSVRCTSTTKSFNRNVSSSKDYIPLPLKPTNVRDDSSSSSAASDEEDGLSTPIPVTESEQYLELEFKNEPSNVSQRMSTMSIQLGDKTEYREIDIEKTTALTNTRLNLEKTRKASDDF